MKRQLFIILAGLLFFSNKLLAQTDTLKGLSDKELIVKASKLHDEGEYEKAISIYDRIEKVSTSYPNACYEKAFSLYYLDRNEEAKAKCREAINLGYIEANVYTLYSSILDDEKNYVESIPLIEKAFKIYPYNQNVLYNYALCLFNTNKIDEAEKILIRSICINPFHANSHKLLGIVNYKKGHLTEAFLAGFTSILMNPSTKNLGYIENQISQNTTIVPERYNYDYPNEKIEKRWDKMRYVLQAEFAFRDNFEYKFEPKYTVNKQLSMLLRTISYDTADTTFYNRCYARFYSELQLKGYEETLQYYILKNTKIDYVKKWFDKNKQKNDEFVNWAQETLNSRNKYLFYPELETQHTAILYFNAKGTLTGVGKHRVGKELWHDGPWLSLYNDGSVDQFGSYINNVKEGNWTVLWYNGEIKQKLNFTNGNLNGKCYTYYSNGNPYGYYQFKDGNKHGVVKSYAGSGELEKEQHFIDGNEVGKTFTNYFDEALTESATYVNDTLNGPITQTWENGKPALERNNKNGEPDGKLKVWASNGQLTKDFNFKNGTRNGQWISYYENGKTKVISNYDEKGELTGIYEEYDRNGHITSKIDKYMSGSIEGTQTFFRPDGTISMIFAFSNNKPVAYEAFDNAGKSLFKSQSENDELLVEYFYNSGALQITGKFKNGLRSGKWLTYTPVGIVCKMQNYNNGKDEGLQETYFADGKIYKSYTCEDDTIVGLYAIYYKSGQIQTVGKYTKNGRDGIWTKYYPNGQVSLKYYYEKNKQEGIEQSFASEGTLNNESFYDNGNEYRNIIYDKTGTVINDLDYNNRKVSDTLYFGNGQIQSVNSYANNHYHGNLIRFYPNGKKRSEGSYYYGKRNGISKGYDFYGNVTAEIPYVYGDINGSLKNYENGILTYQCDYDEAGEQGVATEYYKNGVKQQETSYFNGQRNGYTTYYNMLGVAVMRLMYEDDYIVKYALLKPDGKFGDDLPVTAETKSLVSKYANGIIAMSVELNNGLFDKTLTINQPTGKAALTINYNQGEETGTRTAYFISGKPWASTTYKWDMRNGAYEQYYENGKTKERGNYILNDKTGEWKYFDQTGKLINTILYYNNIPYEIK